MRPALRAIAGFSLFLNLLAFAPALYLMSAFDRVLASRNAVTWAFLTLLLAIMALAYAVLTNLRTRALVRVGIAFDHELSDRLFRAVQGAMLSRGTGQSPVSPVQAMRDLDTIRDNVSGRLVVAAVDLLFAPLFLLGCVLLHPFIGAATLVVMALVALFGFLMNAPSAAWTMRATAASLSATDFAGTMLRNAEAVQALGMTGALQARWKRLRDAGLGWSATSADAGATAGVALTFVSFAGASLVSAVTLLLVIENMASASVLFGAMLLAGRAMQPMATLATNWKTFVVTRYAFQRLDRLLAEAKPDEERLPLPAPSGHVTLEGVTVRAGRTDRMLLDRVSLTLAPGEIAGVVGPSAAGKSCLARVVTGVWPPTEGDVRLDGHELRQWHPDELGRHIGYLPQDVELFPGTIAENIARFRDVDSSEILEAARVAGVHALIQGLEDGYNTQIGEGGARLSGGQRQRIALARAVFGRPAVVVLDEPNASLDAKGEEGLVETLRALAAQGTTVLLVTHKANILSHVHRIIVMAEGRVQAMGPRDEVFAHFGAPNVRRLRPGEAPAGIRHEPAAAPAGRSSGAGAAASDTVAPGTRTAKAPPVSPH
ncbi:type I secretion system permease/ATPase [Alsobacter sp. R-9]